MQSSASARIVVVRLSGRVEFADVCSCSESSESSVSIFEVSWVRFWWWALNSVVVCDGKVSGEFGVSKLMCLQRLDDAVEM